jgi:hypothetical protein
LSKLAHFDLSTTGLFLEPLTVLLAAITCIFSSSTDCVVIAIVWAELKDLLTPCVINWLLILWTWISTQLSLGMLFPMPPPRFIEVFHRYSNASLGVSSAKLYANIRHKFVFGVAHRPGVQPFQFGIPHNSVAIAHPVRVACIPWAVIRARMLSKWKVSVTYINRIMIKIMTP